VIGGGGSRRRDSTAVLHAGLPPLVYRWGRRPHRGATACLLWHGDRAVDSSHLLALTIHTYFHSQAEYGSTSFPFTVSSTSYLLSLAIHIYFHSQAHYRSTPFPFTASPSSHLLLLTIDISFHSHAKYGSTRLGLTLWVYP